LKVKIINKSHHPLPAYETAGAAAFDVRANIESPILLGSLERTIVPTGLFVLVPEGHEMQVRSRSGLPAKHGIMIGNAPGTVDSDYRGELKVTLINVSVDEYTIEDGDRIAQVVIAPVDRVEWVEIDEHTDSTERGEQGFGHTGR
jgi:dUTP pyrophosphatase